MEKILELTIFRSYNNPEESMKILREYTGLNDQELYNFLVKKDPLYLLNNPELFEILNFIDYSSWEDILMLFCCFYIYGNQDETEPVNFSLLPEVYREFVLKGSRTRDSWGDLKLIKLKFDHTLGILRGKITILDEALRTETLEIIEWLLSIGYRCSKDYTTILDQFRYPYVVVSVRSDYAEIMDLLFATGHKPGRGVIMSLCMIHKMIDPQNFSKQIDLLLSYGYEASAADISDLLHIQDFKEYMILMNIQKIIEKYPDLASGKTWHGIINSVEILDYLYSKGSTFNARLFNSKNPEVVKWAINKNMKPENYMIFYIFDKCLEAKALALASELYLGDYLDVDYFSEAIRHGEDKKIRLLVAAKVYPIAPLDLSRSYISKMIEIGCNFESDIYIHVLKRAFLRDDNIPEVFDTFKYFNISVPREEILNCLRSLGKPVVKALITEWLSNN